MNFKKDIRWQQRFNNFKKALKQLQSAVDLSNNRKLTEIEIQGLIKSFEFTHELSWNVMKDFFEYQGNTFIMGSRDAVREAFQKGLITDGEIWMEMIKSRNKTSHTYNEEVAMDIAEKIIKNYINSFNMFSNKMEEIKY